MKITITHLSDIHFRSNIKLNYIVSRIDRIVSAIYAFEHAPDAVLILFSGDISFSGKAEEFEHASVFILNLIIALKERFKCEVFFDIVPGNHDCNLQTSDNIREIVRKSITSSNIALDVAIKMTECQKEFFEFYKKTTGVEWINPIFTERTLLIKEHTIDIQLINSAWMSELEEKPGSLMFPLNLINPSAIAKSEYVITVTHHPYNWFKPDVNRNLRKRIEDSSDIILFGHEHESSGYKKETMDDVNVQYLEGAVLQENTYEKNSGFNIFLLDIEEKRINSTNFEWDNKNNLYKSSHAKSFILMQNPVRPNDSYSISPKYYKYLTDIGMGFTHPEVEDLELSQIFQYPFLRNLDKVGGTFESSIIRQNITDFLINNPRTILLGSEKSGKTTLSKKVFLDFFDKGFFPIMIDGVNIKNHDEDGFTKLLKLVYSEIYTSPIFDVFQQETNSKKVLIIDNFENCRLNENYKCKLIEIFKTYFDHIILVGNINSNFFSYLSTDKVLETQGFTRCELLEFDAKKRFELIRNWFDLSISLDKLEQNRKIIEIERTVTNLIGKNFIPSYPLFILLILQQLESNKKIAPNLGDYGYLYGSLISMNLGKNSKPDFTIDIQLGFLSELAFFMFNNRKTFTVQGQLVTNKSNFIKFTQQFNTSHRLELDSDKTLQAFITSAILEENSDIYFKYSYIYYYFIGKYLHDHINEGGIKALIEEMCKKLHFSEFSNILIFLCYQSKDPFIAQTIIDSSRIFFTKNNEFDIIENSKAFSASVDNLPDIIERINQEDNENKGDQEAEDKKEDDISTDESTFDRELSDFLQISIAFKSINLMGLLLKNFPSLPGETKDELAKEACGLGLRVLDFIFGSLEPIVQSFVEQKLDSIKQNHKDWQLEKICRTIRQSLVGMLETSCFICIKVITNSIGNELIDPLFEYLLSQKEANGSYKFIEISLKLDHYRKFPEREIFNLAPTISKKPFPYYLLKYLVGYYFYVLGSESSFKESVYSRLGLAPTKNLPSHIKK